MRFLIADDEPIVREGLKTIIDWNEAGFTLCDEATDGKEAVSKIMEQNPELVILDIRMPELSGVEVAEEVRRKGYRGKIIILSGYSDFDYARKAIRQGIESYLLKPVDEEELIAALYQAREKIEQENILDLYNNQKLSDTKSMLLKHLLTGAIKSNDQNFECYGLALNVRPFQLAMVDYSRYNGINMNELYEYWRKMYSVYKVEFVVIEYSIFILNKGCLAEQYFTDHIQSYMERSVEDKLPVPLVVISDSFNEVSSFPDIYRMLKNISVRSFFYYKGNVPLYCKVLEHDRKAVSPEKISPIDVIEKICSAILSKDSPLIELTLMKLYHVLQNRSFTIEQTFQILINCILELKALLNKTYIKETVEFHETELINEICKCTALFDIIELLNHKLTSFCNNLRKISEVNVIEKVLNYINIHYNEEIKLEKMAELFGYNPAYLGRLLSSQMGTSFNLYIEKKRMDKAIDMLVNTEIKIPDISLLIGYQNVEYFYRKFKRYTNLTPGNYRIKHQKD